MAEGQTCPASNRVEALVGVNMDGCREKAIELQAEHIFFQSAEDRSMATSLCHIFGACVSTRTIDTPGTNYIYVACSSNHYLMVWLDTRCFLTFFSMERKCFQKRRENKKCPRLVSKVSPNFFKMFPKYVKRIYVYCTNHHMMMR